MQVTITPTQLMDAGLSQTEAQALLEAVEKINDSSADKSECWRSISKQILSSKHYSFSVHKMFFSWLYPHTPTDLSESPAWVPDSKTKENANITQLMAKTGLDDVKALHKWSIEHYSDFWSTAIARLGIQFKQDPDGLVDLSQGIESPNWLPRAKMNIMDSCFSAPADATAILCPDLQGHIQKISYAELDALSNQIANHLITSGVTPGDAIGIVLPMNIDAVAIYIGIIKMGGVVVSIADSFSSQEIYTRLKITSAKGVFTQESIHWAGKNLPLHHKVTDAVKLLERPCEIITISDEMISTQSASFESHACDPMSPANILFSSGTTSEPKAIVWNHTTPIKAASDAHYHQNIQPEDVLAWPTNLGWMMGPWLIFAALINQATIALYPDAPKDKVFGKFVQDAKVTILGVVPTLVAVWRESQCMEDLDWSRIKVLSSTGECSNPADMLYLMSLAGYKPVIEYCGGTEIGGAYVSSTVVEANYPSLFTTPTLGMNFTILDDQGHAASIGEVAIIPPSIGLSTQLLNADHHKVYFEDMPTFNDAILRRHGDQLKQFPNGTYSILGRADDTMNLGGIKVSAADIERAVSGLSGILEVAAIAIKPDGNGPSQLVIYAVSSHAVDSAETMKKMQKKINQQLNPLFKIHNLVFIDVLPKTASNKIMRRKLRSLT